MQEGRSAEAGDYQHVDVDSLEQKTHATSGVTENGIRTPIMAKLSISAGGRRIALVGDSPVHPDEAYTMGHGDGVPRRLTVSNPWLSSVTLATERDCVER